MKLTVPTRVILGTAFMSHGQTTAQWAPIASYEIEVPEPSFFQEERERGFDNTVYHSKPVSSWGARPETVSFWLQGTTYSKYHLHPSVDLWEDMGYNRSVMWMHANTCIQLSFTPYTRYEKVFPSVTVQWMTGEQRPRYPKQARRRTSQITADVVKTAGNYHYKFVYSGAGAFIPPSFIELVNSYLQYEWTKDSVNEYRLQAYADMRASVEAVCADNALYGSASSWTNTRDVAPGYEVPDYDAVRRGEFFLFNEQYQRELWVQSPANYWLNLGRQKSFLDAVNKFPRMNENSISNFSEIGAFVYNLVFRHRIEMPKSLSSGWLAYRYQYTTTKLDVQEAVAYVRRRSNLAKGGYVKQYGSHSFMYDGCSVQMKCLVQARHRELDTMNTILDKLYELGLSPSFYVFWDMIPYSFIVDWIIPVGDVASTWDAARKYSEEHYDYRRICYSLSYHRKKDGVNAHQYSRWPEGHPPRLSGFYDLEPKSPSGKTVGYRILDAASLVLG